MLVAPIDAQIVAAREDSLRVLVIGAGVAGVALAQLLRRQGLHPVIVERAAPDAATGYMLGLLPLVDPVLDQLGTSAAYQARSVAVSRYLVRDRRGRPLREYGLDRVLGGHGDYRGIERGDLLSVLAAGNCLVTYGATVTDLHQDQGRAQVTIRTAAGDGGCVGAEFDLVVAADGMHSVTRGMLLGQDQVSRFDTGVGGWIGWIDHDADPLRFEELWGAGFFIGTYPVPGRIGVFVGGLRTDMAAGARPFVAGVRERVANGPARIEEALAAIAAGAGYLWSMEDRRAARWNVGRVGLLGDAAVGFLPTAGVGAAMAIESAGVLAAALANARASDVPDRLAAFERAQRPRSEAAQDNSRQLAKLMFQRHRPAAALRDLGTRLIPARTAMRPIRRLLDQRPELTPPRRQPI